jgi:uncharacterized protein YraI
MGRFESGHRPSSFAEKKPNLRAGCVTYYNSFKVMEKGTSRVVVQVVGYKGRIVR